MNKKETIKSVTFILSGALLQMFNGIGDGLWSTFTSIFGIILFFIGLSKLKEGLDENGKAGAKLLIISAIIAGIGFIIDLIPLIGGMVASIVLLAAFIVQLIGYLKLKTSDAIGEVGRSGANLLFIAMIVAAFASLVGIVPFLGDIVVSISSFIGLILLFFGWLKVQEGLIEE